jgi:uncharacterized membrane protein YphA (DoxX/SURF4 family)
MLEAAEAAAVIGRVLLGTIFLLAGVRKLRARADFELALRRYELLPVGWPRRVSRSLPVTEVIVGSLLLAGAATRVVAAVDAGLLLFFSAAIAVNLLRGRTFDCGCSVSVAPQRISWGLVFRNGCFAATALLVAEFTPRVFGIDALVYGERGKLTASAVQALMVATAAAVPTVALLAQAARVHQCGRRVAALKASAT